jgi:hypothetical protein
MITVTEDDIARMHADNENTQARGLEERQATLWWQHEWFWRPDRWYEIGTDQYAKCLRWNAFWSRVSQMQAVGQYDQAVAFLRENRGVTP